MEIGGLTGAKIYFSWQNAIFIDADHNEIQVPEMLNTGIILISSICICLAAMAISPTGTTAYLAVPLPLLVPSVGLAVITCVCCFKKELSTSSIGYYAVHIGAVIIFTGICCRYFMMQKSDFVLYGDHEKAISEIPLHGIEYIKLDFSFRVSGPSPLDGRKTQEHMAAKIKFYSNGLCQKEQVASPNHPACFKGWRFYILDYDPDSSKMTFLAKKDPGRLITMAGFWFLITGTFAICFRRKNALTEGKEH